MIKTSQISLPKDRSFTHFARSGTNILFFSNDLRRKLFILQNFQYLIDCHPSFDEREMFYGISGSDEENLFFVITGIRWLRDQMFVHVYNFDGTYLQKYTLEIDPFEIKERKNLKLMNTKISSKEISWFFLDYENNSFLKIQLRSESYTKLTSDSRSCLVKLRDLDTNIPIDKNFIVLRNSKNGFFYIVSKRVVQVLDANGNEKKEKIKNIISISVCSQEEKGMYILCQKSRRPCIVYVDMDTAEFRRCFLNVDRKPCSIKFGFYPNQLLISMMGGKQPLLNIFSSNTISIYQNVDIHPVRKTQKKKTLSSFCSLF